MLWKGSRNIDMNLRCREVILRQLRRCFECRRRRRRRDVDWRDRVDALYVEAAACVLAEVVSTLRPLGHQLRHHDYGPVAQKNLPGHQATT